MRKTTLTSGLLLLLWLASNSALAAGPWKGKIIDIESKEPLEGAVVLAVWERVYRTPSGADSYFYEAREVVTSKAGEFEILSYASVNLLPIISYIRGPLFTIFMPGYGSVNSMLIGDYFTGKPPEEQDFKIKEKRYRYASGVIELPKLKTRKEREREIGSLPPSIPDRAMPNLLKLMNVEEVNLGLQPTHVGDK